MKKKQNTIKSKINLEFELIHKDIKEKGVGIFDQIVKRRVDPDALVFTWPSDRKMKLKSGVQLKRNLAVIEKAYSVKFGNNSPYDLKLFKEDPASFTERMIRAVEICTLNYVLSTGKGNLNLNKSTNLILGKKRMVWEE